MQTPALPEHPAPAVGTQAAAPAAAVYRRTPRGHRPPAAAAPGRHRALHRPGSRRPRPARRPGRSRLTAETPVPTTAIYSGPVEPGDHPTTRADMSHPEARITAYGGQEPADRQRRQDHERSGPTRVAPRRVLYGRYFAAVQNT